LKYRAEIDGLRALAVIPVILFHAGFSLFSGGFVGVDVFFVISGYLITTILIDDIENKRFSIFNFYERRARRILPALFFVMLICVPFAWIFMLPNQVEYFARSLLAVSLFASNFLFWRESGYFDAAAEEKPLLHTWSLAVEEQYYLLFPLFLIFAWRFGKNRVFWMIVFMAALSLLISEWGWRNQPNANFYLAPSRAWELFAGSISAFIIQNNGIRKNNYIASLGLMAILFSIFIYDESTPFPSIYTLVPVLGVVLIILYGHKSTLVARILSLKVIVGLGLISYSAYLWHQPLFAFARISNDSFKINNLMLILSLLSIFLAYLTWRYIENPMRNKEKIKQKNIFILSAFGMIFFCVVGLMGHKTNGFQEYILDDTQLATYKSIKRSSEGNCKKGIEKCISISGINKNKSILLLGDSNAYHFSKGLKEIASEFQYSYIQLTKGGCMPLSINFYRMERPPLASAQCIDFNQSVIDSISKLDNKIDVVVISSAWLNYYYGDRLFKDLVEERNLSDISEVKISLNGIDEIPFDQRGEAFDTYFDNIFAILKTKARNVIIVGSMPPAIVNFSKKDNLFNPEPISMNELHSQTSEMEGLLVSKSKEFNFSYIDIASLMCDLKSCKITKDEQYLYGDNVHFSDFGQSSVMKPIFRKTFNEFLVNDKK
jgi:peptidoglycan/LPS O-acetylase OafA/YrhL